LIDVGLKAIWFVIVVAGGHGVTGIVYFILTDTYMIWVYWVLVGCGLVVAGLAFVTFILTSVYKKYVRWRAFKQEA